MGGFSRVIGRSYLKRQRLSFFPFLFFSLIGSNREVWGSRPHSVVGRALCLSKSSIRGLAAWSCVNRSHPILPIFRPTRDRRTGIQCR